MVRLNESFTGVSDARRASRDQFKDANDSSAVQLGDISFRSKARASSTSEHLGGVTTGAETSQIKRAEPRQLETQIATDAENEWRVNSSSGNLFSETFLDQRELFSRSIPLPRLPVKLEPEALRILRKHFVEQIIRDLRRIEHYTGAPNAADYAASLFRTMRQVRDQAPSDPFVAVVLALHDSLAYKNRWGDYTANQYEQACAILAKFANQELFPEKVEKAVMELEAAGFDTTPFEVEIAVEEE